MNDFCIFDGYLMPDCSNLMWGLVDKMYSSKSSDKSITEESHDDNEAYAEDYLELRGELDILELGVFVTSSGDLYVNLGSTNHPSVTSNGILTIHDDEPELDPDGTLTIV